jgi:peptidoglycan hydrolase-like protein with peptidoglycan-binding domain
MCAGTELCTTSKHSRAEEVLAVDVAAVALRIHDCPHEASRSTWLHWTLRRTAIAVDGDSGSGRVGSVGPGLRYDGGAGWVPAAVPYVRRIAAGRSLRVSAAGRWVLAATSLLLALGSSTAVDAGISDQTSTVRHVAGESAPHIGLIGDSTLSGVRWYEEYGELERFNFVFDAESCRRTAERSCWSREQYRPRNALAALQDEAGDWGGVLVVMTGYNDSADRFAEGVEEMVAEAQQQGIGAVVWLSLRTQGVDYEEPLHLANGGTYRGANRSLYELAGQFGGYLQIADWATYSAGSPDWFESDGAHLTPAGAEALTAFIAGRVDAVLAGETVTPSPPPWEELRDGDEGEIVVDVQEALIAAGVDPALIADGVYGPQTAAAVAAFQRTNGLVESGVVDGPTAVALGLLELPVIPSADVASSGTEASAPTTVAAAAVSAQGGGKGGVAFGDVWWMAPVAGAAAVWAVRRRRMGGRSGMTIRTVAFESEDAPALVTAMPYDHTLEHDEPVQVADLTR